MTQTDSLDPAMTIDRIANANHRIGEVNEPRIRTSLLHIMRDLHDGTDVTRGVRKAAGSAIFGIGLADTILDGDLEIFLPQVLTRSNFDGVDNEVRILKRVFMIRVSADGES